MYICIYIYIYLYIRDLYIEKTRLKAKFKSV